MIARRRAASALLAGLGLLAAACLAGLHPIAPAWALAGVAVAFAFIAWRPAAWLWLVPAAVPLLDFAPWTGGLVIEEFDLLVLASAAALFARRACSPEPRARDPRSREERLFVVAALAFAGFSAASLARGVAAAGGNSPTPAWFQGYTDPLNAWRVVKSVLWAALFWPSVRHEFGVDRDSAIRRLAGGMLGGLLVVSVAATWERAAYPGLMDFSGHYRTTALFWEMHVGGGAIDAYLALAAPFVAWALWSQKAPWLWSAGALLAVLGGYAALTTFSRGVYAAVAVSLLAIGALRAWRRSHGQRARFVARGVAIVAALLLLDTALAAILAVAGALAAGVALALTIAAGGVAAYRIRPRGWRPLASSVLVFVLALEVAAVLGLGTFLRERLAESGGDYVSRRLHWQQGIGLMTGPGDAWLGIGAGRLPAGYGTRVPGVGFPGEARWQARADGAEGGAVRLLGPKTPVERRGLLMLVQRIPLREGRGHVVELDARASTPTLLLLRVCETHLLYASQCQAAVVRLLPDGARAQHATTLLTGAPLSPGHLAWPRRAAFAMTVLNPGGDVEIDDVRLAAPDGSPLLENGDFKRGLAHWLPVAMDDFTPWHIDDLYADILVERGPLALLAFLAAVALVLRGLLSRAAAAIAFAPFLAAALVGELCVGLVDSVMDVPRVAFLLFLLLMAGAALRSGISGPAPPSTPAA